MTATADTERAPRPTAARHSRGRDGLIVLAGLAGIVLAPLPAHADFLKDLNKLNPFSGGGSSTQQKPTEALPNGSDDEEPYCPRVDVVENGAAIRSFAGSADNPNALAYQITIGETARECSNAGGGTTLVKVGVDGRALLGPAGRPGTFSAPLTVQVRRGDSVVVRRQRQISVSVPAGEAQGSFTVVEDGIAVPPGNGDLMIEIGLGNSLGPAGKAGGKRR